MKIPETAAMLVLSFFLSGAVAKKPTVTEINENPSRWWNRKVTLQGRVQKLYSRGSFLLVVEDGGDKDQILVIPKKMLDSGAKLEGLEQPSSGDEVRLTGTVNQVTKKNVTKYFGQMITPEIEVAIKGSMPIIIAQTIRTIDADRRAQAKQSEGGSSGS